MKPYWKAADKWGDHYYNDTFNILNTLLLVPPPVSLPATTCHDETGL